MLPLEDPLGRSFIGLLDGSRSHAQIAEEMARLVGATAADVSSRVADKLADLARMPMLMG